MAKLAFLLGAGAGYVLGARAGRRRYEQLRSNAERLWHSDPVQKQVSTAKHAAKTKAVPAAREAVGTAATAAGATVRHGTDRVTGGTSSSANGVPTTPDEVSLPPVQGPSTFPLGGRPS